MVSPGSVKGKDGIGQPCALGMKVLQSYLKVLIAELVGAL